MNVDLAQELLNVLGSSLENLETQHAALLQLLKDNGVVTDDQLAPYLAQAGKASNVRWRAAHIRLDRLFDTEKQKEEKLAEKEQHKAPEAQAPPKSQEDQAKSKQDGDKGNAAPHPESTDADVAKDGAGTKPASENISKQNQRDASGDIKTPPNQDNKSA